MQCGPAFDRTCPCPCAQESVYKSVCSMCIVFHETVITTAHMYQTEARRHYYVTPTSYMELIQTYLALLGKNREKVQPAVPPRRLATGWAMPGPPSWEGVPPGTHSQRLACTPSPL